MINMDELTLEQAQEGHRALWNWLAETGSDVKLNWPGWENYNTTPRACCFACEIAKQKAGMDYYCGSCPLVWPGDDENCNKEDEDGLWYQWSIENDTARRKELAAQIRDLPWKGMDDD